MSFSFHSIARVSLVGCVGLVLLVACEKESLTPMDPNTVNSTAGRLKGDSILTNPLDSMKRDSVIIVLPRDTVYVPPVDTIPGDSLETLPVDNSPVKLPADSTRSDSLYRKG